MSQCIDGVIKKRNSYIIGGYMQKIKTEFTMFGKTKNVLSSTYTNGRLDTSFNPEYAYTLWVERGEDFYALDSLCKEYGTVRVVERDDWLGAEIEDLLDEEIVRK